MLTIWSNNTAGQISMLLDRVKADGGRLPFDVYFYDNGISLFCDNVKGDRVLYRAGSYEREKLAVAVHTGDSETMQKAQEAALHNEMWEKMMRNDSALETQNEKRGTDPLTYIIERLKLGGSRTGLTDIIIPLDRYMEFATECRESEVDFGIIADSEAGKYVRMDFGDYEKVMQNLAGMKK